MPHVELFERRQDPPPAKVNAVALAVTGTVVWLVATLVVGVLDFMDRVPEDWFRVCLAGLGLGLFGVLWGYVHEYRAQRRAHRQAARAAQATRADAAPAPAADGLDSALASPTGVPDGASVSEAETGPARAQQAGSERSPG